MNEAIWNKRKKRKGFSMLELVIIIMIMTVLAGTMTNMYFQSKEQARIAKADNETNSIVSAMRAYFAVKGKFPPLATVWSELTNNGYLPSVPVDPWERESDDGRVLMVDPATLTNDKGYVVFYHMDIADGEVIDSATGKFKPNSAIYVGYIKKGTGKGPETGKVVAIMDNR